MKTILLSSTQYPGYGGSATNTYYIIKYLRSQNYKCFGLFFYNNKEKKKINYNPDNIDGIILSKYPELNSNEENNKIKEKIINYLDKYPEICMGKNYAAPIFCKKLFPKSFIIYLVSGINHMPLFYSKKGLSAQDILEDDFKIVEENPREIKCIENSNIVVLNSKLCYDIFYKIYHQYNNKIFKYPIDTTKYINKNKLLKDDNGIFKNKKYDILICASNLDRKDKNNHFLISILENNLFDKYSKCIIGDNNKDYLKIKNAIFLGLIENKEVLKRMISSKILLYPSLMDANSNTVREAYYNNCLPLISNNVGLYENFPDCLVCNTFDKDLWSKKISNILNNYNKLYNRYIIKNKINFNNYKDIDFLLNSNILPTRKTKH